MSRESATMPVLLGILAAVLLLTGAAPSWAQGYPNRPVRVVVGFPAGGPTDVIARLVAQKLSDSLGQQFFVENIGGAGGNTAAGQVARATPDGYTIMAISTGFVVNPSLYARVPYDPVKDFTAVTLVAVSPNVVVVNPSVPAKSLSELVKLIKDNPGKYSFAGPGVGSTPHLGASCSGWRSISTWYTCRSPAPGLQSRRRLADILRSLSRPSRPHSRRYRAGSCARSVLPRTNARRGCRMCRRSPNRASTIRKPTRSPASSHRLERPRKSSTCFIERPPTLSGNRR